MNEDPQSENQYLKEEAPLLFEQKRKISDAAPEAYFDSLSANVRARIAAQKAAPAKAGKLRYLNFQNLAIAAGLAVMLALVPVLRQLINGDEASPAYTQNFAMPQAEAEEVFDLVYEPWMDEEWLLGVDDESSLAVVYFSDNIEGQDLENYLMDEGISDALLIEEWY